MLCCFLYTGSLYVFRRSIDVNMDGLWKTCQTQTHPSYEEELLQLLLRGLGNQKKSLKISSFVVHPAVAFLVYIKGSFDTLTSYRISSFNSLTNPQMPTMKPCNATSNPLVLAVQEKTSLTPMTPATASFSP